MKKVGLVWFALNFLLSEHLTLRPIYSQKFLVPQKFTLTPIWSQIIIFYNLVKLMVLTESKQTDKSWTCL
jgi:hypothetical protein